MNPFPADPPPDQTQDSIYGNACDVPRSKPDPSTYLLALDRLRSSTGLPLPSSRCWAIEDTPDGITSARSANLNVLAVTTQFSSSRLLDSGANLAVPDLIRLPAFS